MEIHYMQDQLFTMLAKALACFCPKNFYGRCLKFHQTQNSFIFTPGCSWRRTSSKGQLRYMSCSTETSTRTCLDILVLMEERFSTVTLNKEKMENRRMRFRGRAFCSNEWELRLSESLACRYYNHKIIRGTDDHVVSSRWKISRYS